MLLRSQGVKNTTLNESSNVKNATSNTSSAVNKTVVTIVAPTTVTTTMSTTSMVPTFMAPTEVHVVIDVTNLSPDCRGRRGDSSVHRSEVPRDKWTNRTCASIWMKDYESPKVKHKSSKCSVWCIQNLLFLKTGEVLVWGLVFSAAWIARSTGVFWCQQQLLHHGPSVPKSKWHRHTGGILICS